jgi:protein SCO1/2
MTRPAGRVLRLHLGRALLVLLLCGIWLAPRSAPGGEPEASARVGGPFSLVDEHGVRRTEADFRGRFVLLYFGYTHCPDVCPLTLQTMADAIDQLGDMGERVQPVFITVDPARDTPEVMRAYVAAIHPRLIGLTGSEDEIRAVAKAYRVLRRKVRLGTGDPLDYTVDHSSLVYLLGPSGELLAQLSPTVDAAEMAELLRHYLAAAPAAAPPAAGDPSGASDPR